MDMTDTTDTAALVARLTRERDAERAEACKWFAEYMALAGKQTGAQPNSALEARVACLADTIERLTRERDEAITERDDAYAYANMVMEGAKFALHGRDAQSLKDRIAKLEADNARLQLARADERFTLAQCVEWFQQYADGHTAKGDADKAKRNQDRADYARDALERQP
jgi:uncharacterized coiled-coil DUF342 family protein